MIRRIKKISYILFPVLFLCSSSFLLGAYLLDENSDVILKVLDDMRDVESELISPTPIKNQTKETKSDQWIMQSSDCFPEEKYNALEKSCFLDCKTDIECNILENKIQTRINVIEDFFTTGNKNYTDNEGADITPITTYIITKNEIVKEKDYLVKDNLKVMQQSTAKHKAIWQMFIKLIPLEYRTNLVKLEIITDGSDGVLTYVNPTDKDPTKWVLGIDLADIYQNQSDKIDKKDVTYSLIHEFGHLLTLNDQQVPLDIIPSAITTQEQENRFYKQREKACQPQYYTGDGCSTKNSYINDFFQQFWVSIYKEFMDIEAIKNDNTYYEAQDKFYTKYQDSFVTDYAVTNPEEDLAESWTAFILQKKPILSNNVADKKILFFYNYPDLVKLRSIIRANISRYVLEK